MAEPSSGEQPQSMTASVCGAPASACGAPVAGQPDDTAARVERALDSARQSHALSALQALAQTETLLFGAPEAPVRIARYILLERIGNGAWGTVHAAYDPELDRKVAIKILHRTRDAAHEQDRMREAQAIARLSHPNVVTVHDVGTTDAGAQAPGRVFIVMELVRGDNLAQWMRRRPRSWRAITSAFVAAGRGLAAAHAEGLAHCDFKPDNVLVADDGAIKVADFGLAIDHDRRPATGELEPDEGWVFGTPLYMAPEQQRGAVPDATVDQYAWCVALHEALYGRPPFCGATPAALLSSKLTGAASRPAGGHEVPAALHRLIARGLRPDPAERHRDMTSLVDATERVLHRWQRRAATGTAAIAIAGVAALALATRTEPLDACAQASSSMQAVWRPSVADEIGVLWSELPAPFVSTAWQRARGRLDAFSEAWIGARRQVCAVEPGLAARGATCLDLQLAHVDELIFALRRADLEVAIDVDRLLDDVPAPAECSSVADAALTIDPSARAGLIEAERALVRVQTLRSTHDDGPAATLAGEIARNAEQRGDTGLAARALIQRAEALARAGDPTAARVAIEHALELAERHGHEHSAVQALLVLARLVAHVDHHYRDARAFAAIALAKTERARLGDLERAAVLATDADTLRLAGEPDAALARMDEVLAIRTAAWGEDHPDLGNTVVLHGAVLMGAERLDEGAAQTERGIGLLEQKLGGDHPSVAGALGNLGLAEVRRAEYARARELLTRAVTILEAAADSGRAAIHRSNLGQMEMQLGNYEAALVQFTHARGLVVKIQGTETPDNAMHASNIADALLGLGRFDEAEREYERALAIQRTHFGANHPNYGETLSLLAGVDRLAGRLPRARERYENALAILRDGGRAAAGLWTRAELAMTLLALGETSAAQVHAAPIRALVDGPDQIDTTWVAYARFVLACLDDTDPSAVAHAVLAEYTRTGYRGVYEQELRAWLARRGPSQPAVGSVRTR